MSEPESKPGSEAPIKEIQGRIGRYDIVRPIGKGAMGMVYLAHDTILERDVALKVMVSQIADDVELNQRFIREAKAVAKMHHPNVVNVFDLGNHTDGSPYIAMELLKGQDLQKAMRTPPPMSLDRKVGVIVQVLAGLAHAHQQGIVHRDIKPANVFINLDGTVKIMDFGVARLTSGSMTGTGNIVGTADYMSPEQVKGARVDGRSDLFSVGCMLYELITGRRPFHSENLMAIFYKITHEEPNFDLVPEGAEYDALMVVLKKSLAKQLEDRHQTAYEFAVELRDHLKIYSTSASGEHALEDLLDMEPPPGTLPEPALTNAPGATVVAGNDVGQPTFEVGPTILEPRSGKTRVPEVNPRTTVLGKGSLPTVISEPRPRTRTAPARPTPAPPPASGSPVLYIALGALGVGLLAAATFIALGRKDADPAPAATLAAAPQETMAPVVTAPPASLAPATPPPTAAPPPTFAQSGGRSGATMRQAQAAVQAGDYNRAMTLAQKALAEDPSNTEARRLSDSALAGQKAAARFESAEAALRAGDFTRAMTEADAGRSLAPWDSRAPQLIGRIQRAQEDAQNAAQQREVRERQARTAAQLNGVLGQAESALASEKYDAAIGLYDEALKLDPGNQRAISGRSTAIQARVLAQAGASAGGGRRQAAGRAFVAAKTDAQSTETRTGNVPEGFEDSPGVKVKKGTQAADLPGRINFDIDPDTVKAGERYSVKVYLVNEGLAPIQIRDMLVTTKINGKGVSGPVPPQTRDVAPGQRALLMNTTETWREETSSWSMEVAVRTARGERYTNQVEWK